VTREEKNRVQSPMSKAGPGMKVASVAEPGLHQMNGHGILKSLISSLKFIPEMPIAERSTYAAVLRAGLLFRHLKISCLERSARIGERSTTSHALLTYLRHYLLRSLSLSRLRSPRLPWALRTL
jgi:hypothetical protein